MPKSKKPLKTVLSCALICAAAVLCAEASSPPPEEAIIKISTFEQLCKIGKDPAYPLQRAFYLLTNDIDASASRNMNGGKGFEPIGGRAGPDGVARPFVGHFVGGGFLIKGLYINRPDESDVGLFGHVAADSGRWPGKILSVGLEGAVVIGKDRVGGIAGYSFRAAISSSFVSGQVTGQSEVGGIAGFNAGQIGGCYSAANVTSLSKSPGAYNASAGGLVGHNAGRISDCYATGDVSASRRFAGGLVGYHRDDLVFRVDERDFDLRNADTIAVIASCYSTGKVYSATASRPPDGFGGLVGHRAARARKSVINSYWDVAASGIAASAGGEGKTAAQMKRQSTYAGWAFGCRGSWVIDDGNGYPSLGVFRSFKNRAAAEWGAKVELEDRSLLKVKLTPPAQPQEPRTPPVPVKIDILDMRGGTRLLESFSTVNPAGGSFRLSVPPGYYVTEVTRAGACLTNVPVVVTDTAVLILRDSLRANPVKLSVTVSGNTVAVKLPPHLKLTRSSPWPSGYGFLINAENGRVAADLMQGSYVKYENGAFVAQDIPAGRYVARLIREEVVWGSVPFVVK